VRTADFDYELPPGAIAQQAAPRGESRLLVLDAAPDGRHRTVRDLPSLLAPGDLLVINDTRVIPARLFGRREGGEAAIEVLLLESTGPREWEALTRPGRRTRPGARIDFGAVSAEVVGVGEDGRRKLVFSEPIEPHLDALGHVPLPPYIDRDDTDSDRERYQTVYARSPGAVAAPTAGLHFDEALLAAVRARGVEVASVTLHVGIGTFRPVAVEEIGDHRMDRERYDIPAETARAILETRGRGGRVVAVGTTVVRTLEGRAAETGGDIGAGSGVTEIFITPGYRFQVVDALLTNFHLPRSTLLMLVSAFAGRERVLAAYGEAVAAGYRFFSYGDAMFLTRREMVLP
jgi:S-adenosylmethionine:tRNA ribosyltransferase-isomerase